MIKSTVNLIATENYKVNHKPNFFNPIGRSSSILKSKKLPKQYSTVPHSLYVCQKFSFDSFKQFYSIIRIDRYKFRRLI